MCSFVIFLGEHRSRNRCFCRHAAAATLSENDARRQRLTARDIDFERKGDSLHLQTPSVRKYTFETEFHCCSFLWETQGRRGPWRLGYDRVELFPAGGTQICFRVRTTSSTSLKRSVLAAQSHDGSANKQLRSVIELSHLSK